MQHRKRRVALITGGATGIGAACALFFARNGFDIALNVRTKAVEAQNVVRSCQEVGSGCVVLNGDVASDSDCRRMVAETEATFGRLDVLVNNAGVTKLVRAGDLDALESGDFERIFAVNVVGVYQMVRAARSLLALGAGSVVNVSSDSGFSGYGSSLAYAASKGALNTLTLGLARSLAPEIRVNAVCPGFVDTEWLSRHMSESDFVAFRADLAESSPVCTENVIRVKMALRNVWLAHCVASAWIKWSSAARRTYVGFFPPMQRIAIKRVRTWHCSRTRRCAEPSNGPVPLPQFQSWPHYIIVRILFSERTTVLITKTIELFLAHPKLCHAISLTTSQPLAMPAIAIGWRNRTPAGVTA